MRLTGPFAQIITMAGLPLKGALADEQLEVINDSGIITNEGKIVAVGNYEALLAAHPGIDTDVRKQPMVLLPGFIDCHTHICFDGTRSRDYAMRISGKSYLDIARAGGGIWDSVTKTRAAKEQVLAESLISRANRHFQEGVTTIEVKSGYGLDAYAEIKMLRAIKYAAQHTPATLISTCLAAHMKPRDYEGTEQQYLDWIITDLLPVLKEHDLTNRVDIFIEETAFSAATALSFLEKAKAMGMALTVHADQFTAAGTAVAVQAGALSADHLEASTDKEIALLAASDTVAVVLPGASMGLGMPYAPARRLLDAGTCVAIASDWNPGSAPMGDLLMQAAVMSAAEKLSTAEVLAGLTVRAAKALGLQHTGALQPGMDADFQAYETTDYRDILYYQGKLKPATVWKGGQKIIML
ncbi:imidazolonepropionase [Chitinophaga horti]|uniref:Imidazolonepropionase n=1 Tax=Chitinophaga horti TaxID=2920382 RepID=A0ABY6IVW2_9BACT|nr:imidazolonepropionase [Chitinophaga horti]UYQ91504.1 imidazolonepropionase [Chitinophaga horti]